MAKYEMSSRRGPQGAGPLAQKFDLISLIEAQNLPQKTVKNLKKIGAFSCINDDF